MTDDIVAQFEAAWQRHSDKLDNPESRWKTSARSAPVSVSYRTRVRRVLTSDGYQAVGVVRVEYTAGEVTRVKWLGIKHGEPMEGIRPYRLNERLAEYAIVYVVESVSMDSTDDEDEAS